MEVVEDLYYLSYVDFMVPVLEENNSVIQATETVAAVETRVNDIDIKAAGVAAVEAREDMYRVLAKGPESSPEVELQVEATIPASKVVALTPIDPVVQDKLEFHASNFLRDATEGLISAEEMRKLNSVIENPNFKSGSDELKAMCLNYVSHPFNMDEKDPYNVVTHTLLSDHIQKYPGPEGEFQKTTDGQFKRVYDLMTIPSESWLGSLEDKDDLSIIAAVAAFSETKQYAHQIEMIRSFLSPEEKAAIFKVLSVAGVERSEDLKLILERGGCSLRLIKMGIAF